MKLLDLYIILFACQIFLTCLQTSVETAFVENPVKNVAKIGSFNHTASCPEKIIRNGIYLHGDQRLCNVYHECNCTVGRNSSCVLLRTNLCPIGHVFSNSTNKCESMDVFGCGTSYLQWVDTTSSKQKNQTGWLIEKDDVSNIKPESSYSVNQESEYPAIADINYFVCPQGSNNRFADPYICNIFHVCVTRGDQTYDQPFLCPYSSVFRVLDSNTMYCDKRRESDCVGTAFYRGTDEAKIQMSSSLLLNYTTNKNICTKNGVFEDATYCNTYHRCVNGVDEHYICENQLLYNPLSTLCDYPINVACGKKQLLKRNQNEAVASPESFKTGAKSANLIQNKIKQENVLSNITVVIHGAKINLNCPIGAKNVLIPDAKYCNVFHHCHGGTGNVFICEKGQAFDGTANGPDKSGVCNFEENVNCVGKFILAESGQRPGNPRKVSAAENTNAQALSGGSANSKSNNMFNNNNNFLPPAIPNIREETITGLSFDCRGKANGHWRDARYCDIFHACIGGEQRKTYSCAQLGERVYFDENTKRCEFSKSNLGACMSNQYYQQVIIPNAQQSVMVNEPADGWKQFIRSREQFVCTGRSDGFYASRWCNVFYRCFVGIKSEFLCGPMMNNDRLWWIQHGTSQETPQTAASCTWPCETKKQCTSPGGIIVESGNGMYTESTSEADRVWRSSNCAQNDPSANDIFRLPDGDVNCAGLPEGSFQPSKYCNVFHRCANGQRKDFQCAKATNSPYDLWWNEAANQCDWPCKIRCSKPVYGSRKSAQEIQMEDRTLNEEECRGSQIPPFMMTTPPMIIVSRPIDKPYPDDPYICPGIGTFISPKICNVYYECRGAGQAPVNAFYCDNGYFDNVSKTCRPTNQIQCPYDPIIMYPILPIIEPNAPEDVSCGPVSTSNGFYIIHSNRFCNLYYLCDGRTSQPQTFRCYDRQNLEDAVYNKETRRCESRSGTACQGEILPLKQRYQSSPVDHTRLPELQPLSCRADQQYLAEHDRYCNLYHSCILGRYQMYACVSIGGFNRTSYFYYTNGDCAAPNNAQCGPNKSVFPYDRLFPGDSFPTQNFNGKEHNYFLPVIAPSMAYSGQTNFGYVTLKNLLEPLLECESTNNYFIPHKKFCNLFYECNSGKLRINVCVDQSTNTFAGIFDKTTGRCKPFNMADCPNNSIYNPEGLSGEITIRNATQENSRNLYQYETNSLFVTESKFSCLGRQNGYYESEWCNVFFRCLNGKRIDTKCGPGQRNGELISYDLWWSIQNATYDPFRVKTFFGSDEEAKCEWPCKVKCNKPIWAPAGLKQSSEAIAIQDSDKHPGCSLETQNSVYTYSSSNNRNIYKGYETENSNPSGFVCEGSDGTFRDPLFCNIYHLCANKQRRTFHCKTEGSDGTGKFSSIYSVERNSCISREEGLKQCNGLIYDPNYMNLPAYKELPTSPRSCDSLGVFRATDGDFLYCDLFYWCEKLNAEPLYFQCNAAVFGKGVAFFNPEIRQCDSSTNVNCPYPNKLYSSVVNNQIAQNQGNINSPSIINGLGQPSPYIMQIVAGLLDPAPGYLSLPSNQFQTSFNCQGNAPGYYPNPEYCDLFHYCYANGQFKTYVCASMQNRYQLWWSHQAEPGRRDNIFCDWPCNMIGNQVICPANKRVLMRDRQQIQGGIAQQEVVQSTCPNTGPIHPATTAPPPLDNWQINNFWQQTQDNIHPVQPIQINNQQNTGMNGYPPCTKSMDWFISPATIRCDAEHRLHGFAPDPKDCSKYYRCDNNMGYDNMATGYLMSCIAGLWWDQSRRMCVLPTESTCNPYNIINNQGLASPVMDSAANSNYNQYFTDNNINNNENNGLGSGSPCKFLTCAQAGLSMKNYMKSLPGKLGAFYKCDGQCAVEMMCPLDLIFDDANQRCEWPAMQSQARMASLRAAENVLFVKNGKLNTEDSKACNCTSTQTNKIDDGNKNDLKTLVNEKKAKDQSVKAKVKA